MACEARLMAITIQVDSVVRRCQFTSVRTKQCGRHIQSTCNQNGKQKTYIYYFRLAFKTGHTPTHTHTHTHTHVTTNCIHKSRSSNTASKLSERVTLPAVTQLGKVVTELLRCCTLHCCCRERRGDARRVLMDRVAARTTGVCSRL